MEEPRHTVAIAGATGFIGRVLIEALVKRYRIVGFTRGNLPSVCSISPGRHCPVDWKRCDLYSMRQCENALTGVDTAFYLVHSMLPSARLTQGSFEDLDLIMADNFARAAKTCGVRHIIYLTGFIPENPILSRHLKSRLEVEKTLGTYGVQVTALRTGIVVGPGGASFHLLTKLVERLPVIPCTLWAQIKSQSIALDDVIAILKYVLEHPESSNVSYDIGGPDILSYQDMLKQTAHIMRRKRLFFSIPFEIPFISSHMLAWIAASPLELVSPLVESMHFTMVAKNLVLQERAEIPGTPFELAMRRGLAGKPEGERHRCCIPQQNWKKIFTRNDVRSVQRLPLPTGWSAQMVAQEYARWHPLLLTRVIVGLLDQSNNVRITLFGRWDLIRLDYASNHSAPDRQLFFVTGGLLVHRSRDSIPDRRARLEFRLTPDRTAVLVALHDFRPMLPWLLYQLLQARFHLWFMKSFGRHLASLLNNKAIA